MSLKPAWATWGQFVSKHKLSLASIPCKCSWTKDGNGKQSGHTSQLTTAVQKNLLRAGEIVHKKSACQDGVRKAWKPVCNPSAQEAEIPEQTG